MLEIQLTNIETSETQTTMVYAIPKVGEYITLDKENDEVDYKVLRVSHYGYKPQEPGDFAATLTIVQHERIDWHQ